MHGEFRIDFGTESYRGKVVRQRTSAYELVSWTSEAEHVRREARGIRRDPRGHYELVVPLKESLYVGRDAPDRPLRPGEMALLPIDAPFHLAHDDGATALMVLIPFERVDQRLGPVSPRGQRVVVDNGLLRVTRDLLASLVRERDSLTESDFDAVLDRAVDLFCLAVAGDEAPAAAAGGEIADAARRHVRANATDPELTVGTMSTAIGWSPRSVQAALAREGTTPSELIRQERLRLARTRLGSSSFAPRSIADIAASVGFSSPSAFSSAFRQQFGMAPSEVRRPTGDGNRA